MKSKYTAPFCENGIFHIYNRTNNKEKLFASDENRRYFLQQYAKYLAPFVNTFCWCLLPNHFHFLIQVKNGEQIKLHLQQQQITQLKPGEKKYLENKATMDDLIALQWKRFFNSYAMAFNKQQARSGNLFHRPFKRLHVQQESHFTQAVIYIHANQLKHKLCKDFTAYKWSSWQSLISSKPTLLYRQQVLEWFGGITRLIETHKTESAFYYETDFGIEDD